MLTLGIPTEWNNFVKAAIFLIALVLGGKQVGDLFKKLFKKNRSNNDNNREGKNALTE